MYQSDVPIIAAYGRKSPKELANVLTFVLLSIRVQFGRVRGQMADVRLRGRDSPCLWGWKQEGFDAVQEHKAEIWGHVISPLATPETVIALIANRIPGLAIVKAAFVAQLLGFEVACFDSRNLEILGFPKGLQPWRLNSGCTPRLRTLKIRSYIEATRASGGSEHWWNHWCTGIAPGLGTSPERVSRWHWEIIAGPGHKALARSIVPVALPLINEIPF